LKVDDIISYEKERQWTNANWKWMLAAGPKDGQ